MLFLVQCLDKPNHLEVRQANRPAHLDYLKSRIGHVVIAGAILADDGQTMVGSAYVLDFPDRAAVEALFAGDPYVKAGLYQSVEIRHYRKALP